MPTHPFSPKKRPHFPKTPDPFYQTIKAKALGIVSKQSAHALRITWAKTILYPMLYAAIYLLLLLKGENLFIFYCCYGCMGLLTTLIVFNIVHDAVHHALFAKPILNKRAMLLLDCLGGNSFVWSKRHVVFHHGYTNIPGWDIDIQQSILVRFNEKQIFRKAYHYQFLYMPLLYLMYSLNWILHRDFKDFFQRHSVVRMNFKIPRMEYVKLFFFQEHICRLSCYSSRFITESFHRVLCPWHIAYACAHECLNLARAASLSSG